MKESNYFTFDGRHSSEFNLFIASTSNGLFQENFLPSRKVNDKKISRRDKPYYFGTTTEVLAFSFSFVVQWSEWEGLRREVAKWLYQDYYKPLIFDSNPERVYYCIVEQGDIQHNGLEGIITVNVKCDSPYSYTPEYYEDNIVTPNISNQSTVKDTGSNGTMDNVKKTSKGLEVEQSIQNWVDFGKKYEYWSDIKK